MNTVECGGGCGKTMPRQKASADVPMCMRCRSLPDRVCVWCAKGFRPRRPEAVFCRQSCASMWRWHGDKVEAS